MCIYIYIIEVAILNATEKLLDPLQFTHRTKRDVDDVKLFILQDVYNYKHLFREITR